VNEPVFVPWLYPAIRTRQRFSGNWRGNQPGMDGAEVLRVLARQKRIALVVAVLVLAGGVLFLAAQRPVYESTASVAVLPGSRLNDALGAYDAVASKLLPQYASIVRSQSFLDRVGAMVPGAGGGRQLRSKVFARPDPDAAVLELVARDESPQRAARLAQAALQQFLSQTQGTSLVDLQVIDQPRVASSPVFPRRELVLGSLLVVAAFLAVAAAITWDRLFGRIRDLGELKAASGRPVLGAIPDERLLRSGGSLFVGDATMTALEDSVRGIRTALLPPWRSAPAVIAVTSLERGGGSSTLTANLAVVAAEVGLRVLVADANPQAPRQHALFGLPNRQGLSSVVPEDASVPELVQTTKFPRLRLLTAGPPLRHRGEAVEMYLRAVTRLGSLADLVLVDSPPLSAGADVALLAAVTDGVVLLVRAGSTTPRQLRSALDGLDALGVGVLGLVLTRTSKRGVTWYAAQEPVAGGDDGERELAGYPRDRALPPPVADGASAGDAAPVDGLAPPGRTAPSKTATRSPSRTTKGRPRAAGRSSGTSTGRSPGTSKGPEGPGVA
jgi:receptor protein-tyrosine kinase